MLAALLVISALAALAWLERQGGVSDVRKRNALVARVFAETVTRNIESAALALSTLDDMLGRGADPAGAEMRAAMSQTLANLTFVRGVAVLDGEGRILGSADPSEVGLSIALARLGERPRAAGDRLGPLLAHRRLADLRSAAPPAPAGVGFLPLWRQAQGPNGQPLFVVAGLNAEAFINFQQTALGEAQSASALLDYEGRLIAATGQVTLPAGTDLAALVPFREFLPARERGDWVGAGMRPGVQIGAFTVSATRPLVVVVETDDEHLRQAWHEQVRPMVMAGLAAVGLIALMTFTAMRSQRAREAAQRERDAAQAVVARRERELALTLESLHELVFRTDDQGRIEWGNQRFGVLTEGQPGGAVGRTLWSLVQADGQSRVQALFDAAGGAGLRAAQATASAGGQMHEFDISVMPLREGDRLIGFAGSAVDVTEFRRAARAIAEARDAAEEASRVKGEFVANVSHELRTPLQSIIGFSELGQIRAREHPRLEALFGDVLRAGHRMLALVNDLLDVSRIDSVVGAIHLESVDLRPVVREVIEELRPLADRRGLWMTLVLPEQPMIARVDPLRLQQVMRNVTANAIKFAPPGSEVEIRGDTDDGGLHLAVHDRGPGIPEAEVEKIFEAFVQSSKTKDGSGGTGLGLAISRKLMRAFGGRIHAENRPGGGASFHLWLPARAPRDTLPVPL